jgi:transposase
LSSQKEHGIELYGPVSTGSGWQAQSDNGFDLSHFQIDWQKQQVKCPKRKSSRSWKAGQDGYGNPVIHVQFSGRDCTPCKARSRCTKSKRAPRELTLKPFETYQALQQARDRQATEAFQQDFAIRAGVEGTISQAVRGFEVRQCRYIGLAKTHLQHVITAAAMNVVRVINWLDDIPLAKTRQSHFARLAPIKSG